MTLSDFLSRLEVSTVEKNNLKINKNKIVGVRIQTHDHEPLFTMGGNFNCGKK